jgi:hypothetical protein
MEMTSAEKLIVMMLSEIYEKLGIKRGIDPKFIQVAINTGNTWAIELRYGEFLRIQHTERAVASEVLKIMDTWDLIERSYERLLVAEKTQVRKNYGGIPRFSGFDETSEAGHLGAARFITDHLGRRFLRFKRRDLNSNAPSLEAHRRVLSNAEPLRRSLDRRLLSGTQIAAILDQHMHTSDTREHAEA